MINILNDFSNGYGYWLIALSLSSYYGYRGYLYQKYVLEVEITFTNIMLHYIQDIIYNFISALSGFLALYLEIIIIAKIIDYSNISIGTATFLVFLLLIAVMGISGIIPRMIYKGSIKIGK